MSGGRGRATSNVFVTYSSHVLSPAGRARHRSPNESMSPIMAWTLHYPQHWCIRIPSARPVTIVPMETIRFKAQSPQRRLRGHGLAKLDGVSFRDVPASVWSKGMLKMSYWVPVPGEGSTGTQIVSGGLRVRRHGHGARATSPARRATFVWRARLLPLLRAATRPSSALFPTRLHAERHSTAGSGYGRER